MKKNQLKGKTLGKIFSIIVILSMLMLTLPTSVVQAAPLTSVTDTLTSPYAGVTTRHTIGFTTATDLPANAQIAITFPTGFNVAGVTLGTVTGIDGGFATLSIVGQTITITRNGLGTTTTAPQAVTMQLNSVVNTSTPGTAYKVTVGTLVGAYLDGPTDSATFTISPGATFTPTTGPVGTTITVTGTGWTPSESISNVTVGGAPAAQTLSVNTSGTLSGTIVVPTLTTGAKAIVITGATSGAQTFAAAFTVTTAMSTFTPATGAVGITLTITVGTGWAPSDNITSVTVGGVVATKSLTVDASGVMSGTITVPSSLTPGVKTVVITGGTSGAQTSGTSFTVIPGLSIYPTSGPTGTVISPVTGTGWAPSETVSSVTVGGTTATNTLTISAAGALTGTITVPSTLTAGAKDIVITGSTSGAETFAAAFTVVTTATFTPSSGPVSTVSTVAGTGWVASETISSVTVGGASATNTLTVNGSGVLSGPMTIPTLTDGLKNVVITGTGSGAQTFNNAFLVTSSKTITLIPNRWNLVSLPLVPTSTAIASVLGSSAPYIQVWYLYYVSGGSAEPKWYSNVPSWANQLTTLEAGKSYWMWATQACSFTVTGTACATAGIGGVPVPPTIPLYYSSAAFDGWNMLGFKSFQTSMKCSDYLAGLPATSYSPVLYRYDGAWIAVGANDNMIPGAGYFIRMYSNQMVLPPCN